MKKIIIVSFLIIFNSCVSLNYMDFIRKGDMIIEQFYTDSLYIQYVSEDINIYKETIEGESGDFVNTHIQYYDSKKKLVAYKRISTFFNSCCYDGALKEVSLYSVDNNILKIEKHVIIKEDGSILNDTINCSFNYRFPYKILYDFPSN